MTIFAGITGNPIDGFAMLGPFDDSEAANDIMEEENDDSHMAEWWVAELHVDHADKWENPLIQFARLIDELQASGALTESIWDQMLVSMDLNSDQLSELFDRAQAIWDEAKSKV